MWRMLETFVNAYRYTRAYAYVHASLYIYTHVYLYMRVYVLACMYNYVRAHIYTDTVYTNIQYIFAYVEGLVFKRVNCAEHQVPTPSALGG